MSACLSIIIYSMTYNLDAQKPHDMFVGSLGGAGWLVWNLPESCLNKSATKMDSSKTILKLKVKLFVERKCFINQKSKLKFFGAPTVSRASVASVFSIASTSTVATSSSSFTASSFNRRNRRRLGKFLGGPQKQRNLPIPAQWMMIFVGFSFIEITISVCCLFLFSIPRLAGNCFYQSVFGSASASTSIGASAVLWLGTFETAAEEPLSGGDVSFGRSVVEFGGCRLSANMYMTIWMYVCRYVGMSVYKHIQYDL